MIFKNLRCFCPIEKDILSILTLTVGPSNSSFPSHESVSEGDRKTLTCTVSKGDTPLTLTWLKNGQPLNLGDSVTNHMTVMNLNPFNSVLSFEKVLEHHAAKYTCKASNLAASTELSFTLKVDGSYLISNCIVERICFLLSI